MITSLLKCQDWLKITSLSLLSLPLPHRMIPTEENQEWRKSTVKKAAIPVLTEEPCKMI